MELLSVSFNFDKASAHAVEVAVSIIERIKLIEKYFPFIEVNGSGNDEVIDLRFYDAGRDLLFTVYGQNKADHQFHDVAMALDNEIYTFAWNVPLDDFEYSIKDILKQESDKQVELGGAIYYLSTQEAIGIGDEAYDPQTNEIMEITEENVSYANEEYYLVLCSESTAEEYNITVVRTGYSKAIITVKATSYEEAEKLALEEAGDHDFSNEYDSQYTAS